MADTVTYGLDADLKAKRDAKYDVGLEKEVVVWIETITGQSKGDQSVHEWLKSGVVLCTLANTISPGAIKAINSSTMPFKQMENIKNFMNAARDIGVPESSMFGTPDLFEEKNMGSVMNCIFTYGGAVQTAVSDFAGPKLGVPLTVKSKDTKRAGGHATQTGGFAGTQEVQRPNEKGEFIVRHLGMKDAGTSAPTLLPATAAAPSATSPRPSLGSPAPTATSPRPSLGSPVPAASPAASAGASTTASSPAKPPGSPQPDTTYGLDRDLKAKQEATYDHDLEAAVTGWVEQITGSTRGDRSFAEWLKSGQVLCELANCIRPGIVKKINESQMPFKQMENITFFMNAARELGVPESSMFGTPDLYEEKNIGSVVKSLNSLGGAVQTSCPDFAGPKLGVAVHATTKADVRREKVMATQSDGFAGTLEVSRPHERADYVVKPIDRT